MNQKQYFEELFEYEGWANLEIAKSLVGISAPPEKALSIMSHIVDAGVIWLSRIKGAVARVAVWEIISKEEILKEVKKSSEDFLKFINQISDDDLKNIISYKNTKGENFQSSLKDILTHVIIHSSYHRGQVIILIKPWLESVPYTDYIHYIRNVK